LLRDKRNPDRTHPRSVESPTRHANVVVDRPERRAAQRAEAVHSPGR
jgi:hypothetical protein